MFDIGFSELLLIAVVALVVLGPERLPKAARFAGLWVRRARAQWDSVKQELERELEAEELKRSLQDVQVSLRQAESQLCDSGQQLQRGTEALRREIDPTGPEPHADAAPAVIESQPAMPVPEPLPPSTAPAATPTPTPHLHAPTDAPRVSVHDPVAHATPAPGAAPPGGDPEASR
ncbi:Sec-independent protein translocase protein TatB [Xanthomonas theicola]|uniref:Sec-independent protein translocase protein TatB n=1 Tax=Xanthomonas theicola TaxID=56464 RepID=A0A2S6ZCY0_9XANT|nr:Sec-independent protein translocase protein TatB [Xanthomonas theicola]PPT87803.1 twin-arginine translocase subunit TatB [Xanthomonas theicola]QNH26055.1 twin-arginine translocase subunit TatB [Xanthomonas theicola]